MNVEERNSQPPSTRAVGLHLMPLITEIDGRRPSVLATLDEDARLTSLERLDSDAAIATAIGQGPALVCVDQPLVIGNLQGQRALEQLLSWCDAPTLPISVSRLESLYGGCRGVQLADQLAGGDLTLAEAFPDLTLRQLIWEYEHPGPIDLERYRGRWLNLRAPKYRPKGAGRARTPGLLPAWEILARVIDMNGWTPGAAGDDWDAIADAAKLDAIICAHAAWRALRGHNAHRTVRCADGALAVIATGPNLAERLEIHAERMGGIIISPLRPGDDRPRIPA